MMKDSYYSTPLGRLMIALPAQTQLEGAKRLGIRQSLLSECSRLGMIVTESVMKKAEERGINPHWILYGTEPIYLSAMPKLTQNILSNTSKELEDCPAKSMLEEVLRIIRHCPRNCRICPDNPQNEP